MSERIQLTGIRQIALTVRDLETALPFYRDVLGLPFLFSPGPDLAFLEVDGIRLMLSASPEAARSGASSVLYFSVPDAAAAHGELVSRGATPERGAAMTARMPDHELWIAFVRDPDGNLIGLMEERR